MDANIVFPDASVCVSVLQSTIMIRRKGRMKRPSQPSLKTRLWVRKDWGDRRASNCLDPEFAKMWVFCSTLVCRYILLPQSVVLNLWTAWTLSVFLKRCHQARYGSLKIKGKKRPALSAVNYGVWRHYCCHIHTHSWAGCWLVDGTVSLFLALTFHSAELFDDHLSADIFITRSGSKSAPSQRTRADFVVGRVICFFLR